MSRDGVEAATNPVASLHGSSLLTDFLLLGGRAHSSWRCRIIRSPHFDRVTAIVYNYPISRVTPVACFEVMNLSNVRIPLDVDDLVKRHTAGESVRQIAISLNVSESVIWKRLNERGIESNKAKNRRLRPAGWKNLVVERYQSGETQTALAAAFNTTQQAISLIVAASNARITRSEAERRKWSTMTAEQRTAQYAAAHAATKGRKPTDAERILQAISRQNAMSMATDEEGELAAVLRSKGLEVIQQQAVGPYNLDFGIAPVAVELFGGGWHAWGAHLDRTPKRLMDLADAGWNIVIVWTRWDHRLDHEAVARDVVAYHQVASADPSFTRQYRVIWGDGQFQGAGCVDDDDFAFVPADIRRNNAS